MTTYRLTPKAPHPVTGLSNELLGWRVTGATAMDVFEGMVLLQRLGWRYKLTEDDDQPDILQQILIYQNGVSPSVMCKYGDWFATDGAHVYRLTDAEAQAHNITVWAGPPPAPDPDDGDPPSEEAEE